MMINFFKFFRKEGLLTIIKSGESWFDSMLGNIKYKPDSQTGKMYPFFLRVGCIKRRPPRHKFFEYFIDFGCSMIDDVMHHGPLKGPDLAFVFPERHMGVAEQQSFLFTLEKHPEIDKIKNVDIITSSPLIISGCMRDHIRIISWDDDHLYDGN